VCVCVCASVYVWVHVWMCGCVFVHSCVRVCVEDGHCVHYIYAVGRYAGLGKRVPLTDAIYKVKASEHVSLTF
jgi:hypothetical protein